MKSILLIIILTFGWMIHGSGQSFTLQELESISVQNVGEIEDLLLRKGYESDSYDSFSSKTIYRYATFGYRGIGSSFFFIQPVKNKED